MASAMEKMVASMLGITPEEMGAMMTGFQELLKNLSTTLGDIKAQGEANNALLIALMERLENDGSRNSGKPAGKRSGNTPRIAGSGDASGDAGTGDASGD